MRHSSARRILMPVALVTLALLSLVLRSSAFVLPTVSVLDFGAKGDGIMRTDGAMTAGSAVLTSASSSFSASDVGKYIQVVGAGKGGSSHTDGTMSAGSTTLSTPFGGFTATDVGRGIIILGAGPAGGNLITTIFGVSSNSVVTLAAPAVTAVSNTTYFYGGMTLEATIQSVQTGTSVTLSAPAVATATSAMFAYGTDDHAAIQAALDSVGHGGGGTVHMPAPASCPSGAVCGYVAPARDMTTAKGPAGIKIRYDNITLTGDDPQTNVFCRGAWDTYTNTVTMPGTTATIRGNCVRIGDNGGPLGAAGTAISNATVAKLHLYGMTNGNTYSTSFTPNTPPLTTTGDGWDETHKAIHMWDNSSFSNITIDSVYVQDFKGEMIYSGGSIMSGIVIKNSTITNFNGDGISMLAASMQVLNNSISNGSNAGVENSTASALSGAKALVSQVYDSNTISFMQREGINVVGIDNGIAAGSVQITNNYFDLIGQIHGDGTRAAIYINPQKINGVSSVAPSNVTATGNTCHDCYTFGNFLTSGTTLISGNTFIVDQRSSNSFMSFANSLTDATVSNNIGYFTPYATAHSLKLTTVYSITQGGGTVFHWQNAVVKNNSWNFPGMPNYTFVTSAGLGSGVVGTANLIWQGETCTGCTYPDGDHGLVNIGGGGTIEPYGPVVAVKGSPGAVGTIDKSREDDSSETRILNPGTGNLVFNNDANLSLVQSIVLPPGNAVTFVYSGSIGKYILKGATNTIAATAGTPQSATVGTAFTTALQATVKDSGGTGVSGATVTFTAPASGSTGAFSGAATASAVTDGNGVATAPVLLTANSVAGGYTVTASTSTAGTPASFTLTNTAGSPATITATGGTPQSKPISTAFATPLQATVKDSGGNLVTGASVIFQAPASGASGTFGASATVTTNTSGIAAAPAFTSNSVVGAYTVTATVTGASSPASFSLTNTVGSPSTITANAGTTPQARTISTAFATALAATVQDAGANPVSGVVVTFSAPATGASAKFGASLTATATTNASGIATASTLTANSLAGGYTVTAGFPGVATLASFSLTNNVGAPATITATTGTPQSTVVSTNFATPLKATVTDSGGNLVVGANVTFSAPATGASAKFGSSTTALVPTDGSGVATAPTLTANGSLGAYTLNATVTGVSTPANFSLTNTVGGAATVAANAGTSQSMTINAAFSTALQALVKDSGGNPINGIVVTFAAPASGASAKFGSSLTATATTNSSGIATAPTLTANGTAGAYAVTAAAPGAGTSASFSLTNLAGLPTVVSASLGTPQGATVGTLFATGLQATVTDIGGNPVNGVLVTFTAPATGASAKFGANSSATATTNPSGIAVAPNLTANSVVGGYTVQATVSGIATPANFSLNNTALSLTGGSLVGVGTSSTAAVNLTTEGTADWEHWGTAGADRKAGVTPLLSAYSIVGAGSIATYNDDLRAISWTDGVNPVSSSGNKEGIYIGGMGQGFSLTAPADSTQRTLTLHIGGWKTGGTLTAHLSDGSAVDFTDITAAANGQYDRNYTLTYHAAAPGQTLTVKWVVTSALVSNGNVTMNGAALQ